MPPTMAISTEGQVNKDQYLNNSNKELSQEMFMWNNKAQALTVEKLSMNWNFWQCGRQDKNNQLPPIFDVGGIIKKYL